MEIGYLGRNEAARFPLAGLPSSLCSAERHGFEPVLHTTFINTIYVLPWEFIMLFYQLTLLICKFFMKKVTIIP